MGDVNKDGTVVSRRMVVQEVQSGFSGTQEYRTLLDVEEVLREELESDGGGHDHIWFDVECPTCGAPPETHCSGDAAERPQWMRDDDTYWDKPCAKRVIASILGLMDDDADDDADDDQPGYWDGKRIVNRDGIVVGPDGDLRLADGRAKGTITLEHGEVGDADDGSADDPIPDDFDYGDRRPDGQFENYPTIDDGDFVQAVRSTYVHDVEDCGAKTTMTGDLPESVARAPDAYGKTFCSGCELHVPVDEVVWDEDGQDWVMDDPYPGADP